MVTHIDMQVSVSLEELLAFVSLRIRCSNDEEADKFEVCATTGVVKNQSAVTKGTRPGKFGGRRGIFFKVILVGAMPCGSGFSAFSTPPLG